MIGEPEGALGLYVHIPFCEAKCTYCHSFDDGVLSAMGRHHVASDSARAAHLARAAGFASLSFDLILGWPGRRAGAGKGDSRPFSSSSRTT